jgi:hypothetical protein
MFWRNSSRVIVPVELVLNAVEEKKRTAARESGVDFVSTNDLLTSAFLKVAGGSVNMMMLNMRGRIQGLADNAAGNYTRPIVYRPTDVATAGLIRKSLETFKRAAVPATPMPGFWDMARGRTAAVTSWVGFYKDVKIGSRQIVHLPLIDDRSVRVPFKELCVIFRPSSDRLALYSNGSARMLKYLENELGLELIKT